ncbi:MAG: Tol-Pal system beta propeller repeat protein TolB [Nitrospirales bacterium]|nr:Tol-Pal system beta propeller repeat protein TolB [Nitrospira sp.]MDR4501193.1 Tol-Pal system beta propeller repeat protein TolB [Nitrospirales bacterium]
MTRMLLSFILLVALSIMGKLWVTPLSFAQDALLEASRPDFQRIPIWVRQFGSGTSNGSTSPRFHEPVVPVLKADLKRSQIFTPVDLPATPGKFAESKCVGPADENEATSQGVTVSTWGRVGVGRTDNGGMGLVFDACAHDSGTNEFLLGKRYFSLKVTDPLVRLMAHRWADELVYRYTGEPGIARTKIAYVSEEGNGREIFVMDYDGYGPQQVTADGFLNLMPAWAPDRKSLVYTAYRQRKQQIVQRILASGEETVLVQPASLNITPVFSPNGKQLSYASAQEGNSDIYTLDLDTKAITQITSHRSADLSPSWSPDGKKIAFTSDRGGRPQIYIMDADGSNSRRLTYQGDYNAAPTWSPRGDWIAFVCRISGEGFKLCRITPDGNRQVQITSGKSIDDSPSWSPNGRHIVFSSIRRGKSDIYLINSDGTDLEQLTSEGTHHSSPSWSPL